MVSCYSSKVSCYSSKVMDCYSSKVSVFMVCLRNL